MSAVAHQRSRKSRRALALLAAVCTALAPSVVLPGAAWAQSTDVGTSRVGGSNVYELAAAAAGGRCDTRPGRHSVALASGENWPDALAAAALDRPLLLSAQGFLPAATRAYLEPCSSHERAKVIILGGTSAVSEDVAETLRLMGYRVDRVAGSDRYETARKAAKLFAPDELDTVYVASGANFADAVAATPFVSRETPLILTEPEELSESAREFLTAEGRTISSVTILGGTAAVSATVENAVAGLGLTVRRLAGADRYETAAAIARRSLASAQCHPVTDVAVASGTSPYAGLAAGAMRDLCRPLLLAAPPSQGVPEALAEFGRDWLLAIGSAKATVTAIGAPAEVPDAASLSVATGTLHSPNRASGTGNGGDQQSWEQVAGSVVLIDCLDSSGISVRSGSGFAVSDGQHLVTNHHVVFDDRGRQCGRIVAWTGGTFEQAPVRRLAVTLLRSDRIRDLALLRIDAGEAALTPVPVAAGALRAGETITALGYPSVGGETMTLTTGRYSGITRHDGVTWIKTDTQISPGNSGGPAFNAARQLIGVTTAISLAQAGAGGDVVGTLGLLVPAADVTALIDGDLGTPGGDGSVPSSGTQPSAAAWFDGDAADTGEPYIATQVPASRHDIGFPHGHVEPLLAVFCADAAQVVFWDPLLGGFRGPFIAGQISLRRPDQIGRVPVAYRVGDDAPVRQALWWPTASSRGIGAGSEGPAFVAELLERRGELEFSFANHDGAVHTVMFGDIAGFGDARRRLQTRCDQH